MADKIDLIVDRLDDVKESCDKIQEDMGSMKLNIARNSDSLDHHIRRTDLLEKHLKIIEDRLTVSYLLKLSMSAAIGLGSIASAIYAVIKVLSLL